MNDDRKKEIKERKKKKGILRVRKMWPFFGI